MKYNFAKHRVFKDLESWQAACLAWLNRTGNYKIHHNIKERPFEVHALEKPHLQKIHGSYLLKNISPINITRKVHKDNVIRLNGNRYSVPLGTFQNNKKNTAYITLTGETLNISLHPDGSLIATHQLSKKKGKIIIDSLHRKRVHTKREVLVADIMGALTDAQDAAWLLNTLRERYPRHLLDQLKIVLKIKEQYPDDVDEAVKEMRKLKLTSANDLRDIAISFNMENHKRSPKKEIINEKYKSITAPERKQDIYLKVLQGGK